VIRIIFFGFVFISLFISMD